MFNRAERTTTTRHEGGFTLIELLVVIIILGVLAAVVVFAVGGIGDKGQASSCTIDTRTLRTAQEAYAASTAGNGNYAPSSNLNAGGNGRANTALSADEGALVAAGFLSENSQYHYVSDVVAGNPATNTLASFKIRIDKDGAGKCGAPVDTEVGTGGAL